MARSKGLVLEQLENVSGQVLETHQDVIRRLIRGRSGIYALYRRGNLYYVGLASNLMTRLKQHLRDRHKRKWDRFSIYVTSRAEHIKELESLVLRIVRPRGNVQSGRLSGSTGLRRELAKAMKEEDDDRRARLLGGQVQRRRRRVKATRATGAAALSGLVERSTRLRGWRGEWEYQATLKRDGTIVLGDDVFSAPSSAATTAVGHRMNGWAFWHFRDADGQWVPLRDLRR